MLIAKNIHKSFGDLEVLKGIDLHVAPQEVVVLVGVSGSGKSTLLRCFNFLEMINNGEITIDGKPVNHKKDNLSKKSPTNSVMGNRTKQKENNRTG